MSDSLTKKQFLLIVSILFVVSFIVRLVYLNQIDSMPTFENPIMDEQYHVSLADQINSVDGLPDEPYFRAPLYPYFLASLFRITSHSYYWSRLIQIILGSLLPVLIFLFGLKLFDKKIALIAAGIAVFYPTFLYYDASLLITSLMVLITTLLLYRLYLAGSESYLSFIICGLILGVAGLARPNILLLGPLLFIWIWFIIKPKVGLKKALISYVLIGLTALVVILPTTIRNYTVSGDPVFIAWQGGLNFYIGNNQQSNGWSATLPGINKSWEGGYKESIAFARQQTGQDLKWSEVSDFWYDKTFDEINADKGHFISLIFKKIRIMINGYEIPNNQNIYLAREYSSLLKPLMLNKWLYFPFGLIAPLAIIGLFLSLRHWRKFLLIYLFILAYGGSFVLFFVCARFRQPLIPIFLLMAVYAGFEIYKSIKDKNYKSLALIAVCLVVLIFESNHNILGLDPDRTLAEDHHLIGNAYLDKNLLSAAEAEYQKSIKADPTYAESYNNLGLVNSRKGKPGEALKYYKKSIELNPTVVESHLNLATYLININNHNEAIKVLHSAQRRFPLNDFLCFKLSLTYYEIGQLDSAKTYIKQCLSLNPNNPNAKQVLDLLNNQTGN